MAEECDTVGQVHCTQRNCQRDKISAEAAARQIKAQDVHKATGNGGRDTNDKEGQNHFHGFLTGMVKNLLHPVDGSIKDRSNHCRPDSLI